MPQIGPLVAVTVDTTKTGDEMVAIGELEGGRHATFVLIDRLDLDGATHRPSEAACQVWVA
jgi:DNA gyrase inhibitor GyrI